MHRAPSLQYFPIRLLARRVNPISLRIYVYIFDTRFRHSTHTRTHTSCRVQLSHFHYRIILFMTTLLNSRAKTNKYRRPSIFTTDTHTYTRHNIYAHLGIYIYSYLVIYSLGCVAEATSASRSRKGGDHPLRIPVPTVRACARNSRIIAPSRCHPGYAHIYTHSAYPRSRELQDARDALINRNGRSAPICH